MGIQDSPKCNEAGAQEGSAGEALRNQELGEFAYALVTSRQNVSPRRLFAPAPTADQLLRILEAAAAAPDHGTIVPWRFVIVPDDARELLAEAFAAALADRDPQATDAELAAAGEKARRAPLLMLAVVRLGAPADAIPDFDRLISLGCAIQNMLVTVHSLGYGAGLTSGRGLRSVRLRDLFRLAENEHAVCFINIGTVSRRKPLRARPPVAAFTSTLQATSQA